MADRPILFSAPMIRALLAGRKTVTRRVLQHQEPDQYGVSRSASLGDWWWQHKTYDDAHPITGIQITEGDRLYVRETFSGPHRYDVEREPPRAWLETDPIWYWADGNPTDGDWTRPKPGIHMPRWASRLTLTVTDVRVERLQDITEEQARAEGCIGYLGSRAAFATVWREINGDGSWDENPWVAAYTFTVAHHNIDARD